MSLFKSLHVKADTELTKWLLSVKLRTNKDELGKERKTQPTIQLKAFSLIYLDVLKLLFAHNNFRGTWVQQVTHIGQIYTSDELSDAEFILEDELSISDD